MSLLERKNRIIIGLSVLIFSFTNISITTAYADMKDCNVERIRFLVNRACGGYKRSVTSNNPTLADSGPVQFQSDDEIEEVNPEEGYIDILMNSIVKIKRIPRSKQIRFHERERIVKRDSFDTGHYKTLLLNCCSSTGCTASDFTGLCNS